jgi:GNAT superfamily N-acetyltransferase
MSVSIGLWSEEGEVPEITRLLHQAYAPLAAMGFRYLASHQDDAMTRKRLRFGQAFIAREGGRIVGTIALFPPGAASLCSWYARPGVMRFGQFGVLPECQGAGVGALLLEAAEARAAEIGATELACDTAEGASRLIEMYGRRGYRPVGDADWEVTNYRSVILSKRLSDH